jgi:hypothetical protein
MASITIRITTFTVRPPRPGHRVGEQWNELIDRSFVRAGEIYGRHGITIRRGRRVDHGVEFSRQVLTRDHYLHGRDIGYSPRRMFREQNEAGEAAYRRSVAEGRPREHYRDAEYWVRVANCVAYRAGGGTVAREALQILTLNNNPGEVATYWVPGITNPEGSAADTACSPMYGNVRVFEGIFIGPTSGRDTLAHELGHILMRCGHCADPDHDPPGCDCAGRSNLMHAIGYEDRGTELTEGQVIRLKREGALSRFIAGVPMPTAASAVGSS